MSTNLALKVEENNVIEQGLGGEGSWGSSTGTGAGTGSSGGVNPGGLNTGGGVTPGGGPSSGVGPSTEGAASPGWVKNPAKSRSSRPLSAQERASRREKAAQSDKDFDCSGMQSRVERTSTVSEANQLMMGRNPKGRFCCTGGPPTSGIWDGIFYTNSPGKFITLRTNCIDCTLVKSVIIRIRAPF